MFNRILRLIASALILNLAASLTIADVVKIPGDFPAPLGPEIPGIPTDGGFGVVDASSHSARADEWDEFDFGSGPVRRYAAEPAPGRSGRSESIWAGGTSSVPFPGNPYYSNLLPRWLTNATIVVELSPGASRPGAYTIRFVPAE